MIVRGHQFPGLGRQEPAFQGGFLVSRVCFSRKIVNAELTANHMPRIAASLPIFLIRVRVLCFRAELPPLRFIGACRTSSFLCRREDRYETCAAFRNSRFSEQAAIGLMGLMRRRNRA